MSKKIIYKIMCLVIIFLFIFSAWTPISGQIDQTSEFNESASAPCLYVQEQEALVTCSTYGIGTKDTEQKAMISQLDAKLFLDKIEEYSQLISQDPQSPEAQTLQEEIINLAIEYDLVPKETLSNIRKMRLPQQKILPKFRPKPMSTANEWFCNYAAGGEGGATPVIIFPRLTPILLLPIPRLFYRWNARYGFASCGGLRSGTGFMAGGQQTGRALGFWGIGFSIFLPPVMAFGIIGYALYCSVEAEHIEFWPPNYPPDINPVFPLDGAINIPISTSELSFYIDDYENELMSYSVITSPDIGGANANLKPDGIYTIPISGLEGTETYSWTVTVSDGPNTVQETYNFTTEPVAPIVENPVPEDGLQFVPITLTELQCHIQDPQGDQMDYTIETSPDIGSGSGTVFGNGWINIPVYNLKNITEYRWYVNVTDGTNWKHKVYSFQIEPMMVFNPFDEGWQYRKKITINHTKVTGPLQDYPMLLSIIDSDLKDKTQANAEDILFMDDNGTATRLFHEIEFYDKTTGKLDAWIQIPLLPSDVDFSLYIYYGNQNCTSQETTQGVWDENYLGVWHLDEKTGIPTDSTRYQNDASDYEQQQDAYGMIDGADGFDGLDDYIHVTSNTLDIPSSITIEAWARMDYRLAADGWQRIYQKGSGKSGRIVELWIEDETQTMGQVVFRLNKKTSSSNYMVTYQIPGFSYGTWYHYTAVFDDGDNTLSLYINGEFKNSEIFNNQIFTGYKDNYIGNRNSNGDRPWNGVIDEVRISNIERSDSWIATNYNNQYFPSMFYTIDPEETGP